MERIVSVNWCPKTHKEFVEAASDSRVQLSILPQQYGWLYDNVIPFSPLYLFFSYKKKLLKLMVSDEVTFRKVHDKGIDLVLYAPGHIAPV